MIVFLLNRENKTLEAKYELATDSLQFMSNATDLAVKHNQWHTETPPVEVKLSVVTYAWYNNKGEWQSYSNGSVIDVLEWRPE